MTCFLGEDLLAIVIHENWSDTVARVQLVLLSKSSKTQLAGIAAVKRSVFYALCITFGCSVSFRLREAPRCTTPGCSVCI